MTWSSEQWADAGAAKGWSQNPMKIPAVPLAADTSLESEGHDCDPGSPWAPQTAWATQIKAGRRRTMCWRSKAIRAGLHQAVEQWFEQANNGFGRTSSINSRKPWRSGITGLNIDNCGPLPSRSCPPCPAQIPVVGLTRRWVMVPQHSGAVEQNHD